MTSYFQLRGAEFLVNSETYEFQERPSIAGLAGGGFVVTWYTSDTAQDGNQRAVKAQVFDAVGAKLGSEFLVNTGVVNNQQVPTVTGLTNGGFVITWETWDGTQDGSGTAIMAQVFDAAGTKQGSEFLVNTAANHYQYTPDVASLAGGGFVITWRTEDSSQDGSYSAIKAQVFDAAGSKQGSEFRVNSYSNFYQAEPVVTGLTNGNFVITWQSNDAGQDFSGYGVKAQLFDAAGSLVGTEFLVNTATSSNQYEPTITALSGGGFVISWRTTDYYGDGSDSALKAQVFDAAGVKQGGEFRVNTQGLYHQYQAEVTGLTDGGFVVTWYTTDSQQDGSGGAIKAQVFDAAGVKQGQEFLVNTETLSSQLYPTTTALADGGFVISWETYDTTQDGSGGAIKAQVFERDLTPSVILSRTELREMATEGQVVGQLSIDAINGDATGLTFSIISDDAGAFAIKGDLLVVADPTALDFETDPEIAVVLQAEDGEGNTYSGTFDIDVLDVEPEITLIADAEFLVNTETYGAQAYPSVAALSGGDYVVVWQSYDNVDDASGSGIKAQIFDRFGTPKGAELLVNTETLQSQMYPEVAPLAGGGFAVTWQTFDGTQDGSGYAIKAQVFDAAGAKSGGEFLVNTEADQDQREQAITQLSNGDFVITWTTYDQTQDGSFWAVKGQIFDAAGSQKGSEFLVNTEATGSQYRSAVTDLANGGFVVTWYTNSSTLDANGNGVHAQIFDAAGVKQGGEFLVNTETTGSQLDPAIATLSSGNFVVTWYTQDSQQDGDGYAIKAQLFDATGAKIGAEFLVNTDSVDDQYQPTVTGLPDGRFVITWYTSDPEQDGSGSSLRAQVFAADGSKLGTEFQVNTEGESNQSLPRIAGLSDGSFVITWYTPDQLQDGSSSAVKARRFDFNGDPVLSDDDLALAATEDVTLTGSLVANVTDPDGDTLTFTLDQDVAHGSLTLDANGDYSYVPDADFNGTDSFTYTVDDGVNPPVTGTVTLTVAPVEDAPVISGTATGAVEEDVTATASGALSVSDADAGDTPVFTAQTEVAGSYGTFTLAANGAWSYTLGPAAQTLAGGEVMTDVFTAVATTGDGETVSQAVTITVTGTEDAPVIAGTSAASVEEDVTATASGALSVSDADAGDTPVFTAQTEVAGSYGTFTLAANGAWSYTLGAAAQALAGGEVVTDVFTAVATTGDGETVSQAVTITVTGQDDLVGGSGDDTLLGTALGDELIGNGGDDTIRGLAGPDTLYGGAGHDDLRGGAGADSLFGGSGEDTVDYGEAGAGLVLNLRNPEYNTGDAAGDVSVGVEVFRGSDHADTMIGDVGRDVLWGMAGADELDGRSGDDALDGGGGADRIHGKQGADELWGASGDDSLYGGADDDTLYGGSGSDFMMGGNGYDRVQYTESDKAVLLDLRVGGVSSGDAAGDRYHTIEEISGSRHNDTMIGGNGSDVLLGHNGDDVIEGNGLRDTLYGQRGNDTLSGGGRDDVLNGGIGEDMLYGGGRNDELYGGYDSDTLMGGAGADLLDGGDDGARDLASYASSYSAVIADLGDAARNTGDAEGDIYRGIEDLEGSDFDDELAGDALDNAIFGGAGDDTLLAGEGGDTLTGGAGADVFVFTSATDAATVTDLTLGDGDRMALDGAAFAGLAVGAADPGQVVIDAGAAAGDADDLILVDTATGLIYYDADGDGAETAVLIARILGAGALDAVTASDFEVL